MVAFFGRPTVVCALKSMKATFKLLGNLANLRGKNGGPVGLEVLGCSNKDQQALCLCRLGFSRKLSFV